MLLWIQNSLSPLEIRSCVMDPTSDFQRTLVEYLERSHQGEFLNGTVEDWMTLFGDPIDIHVVKRHARKNNWRTCKARFPRELHQRSEVDPRTGHINLKKGEAWINTFTPIVTYLLRCNSDVTSLLSGTAIKAVIAYVTDYVSKKPSQNIWYI
ncbi:hypothetical protein K439DRAFT_1650061 [Ramaria rubella]|nr:hypothetical protein K439DRAFT_1650061 [Ramaria rubella]